MPKCDFNKNAKQLYWNHTWHGYSPVNLLHICRTPFPMNTSGRLLTSIISRFIERIFSVSSFLYNIIERFDILSFLGLAFSICKYENVIQMIWRTYVKTLLHRMFFQLVKDANRFSFSAWNFEFTTRSKLQDSRIT